MRPLPHDPMKSRSEGLIKFALPGAMKSMIGAVKKCVLCHLIPGVGLVGSTEAAASCPASSKIDSTPKGCTNVLLHASGSG